MKKYLKIVYHPAFESKIKIQYLELDSDGYVTRNLEELRQGGYGLASSEFVEDNGAFLPEGKILIEDIHSSTDEFETIEITPEAFEDLWNMYGK
ncbi:MAG: hypothetical protein K2Q18_18845 [Bdellovibrionales bacterium]|nr:hypothetical protein [Bdellovibrionales bacterium]